MTYKRLSESVPLNDLSDVTISSVADTQVLKYNASLSKWTNQADATGGGGSTTIEQYNLMSAFPFMIGATAPTAVRTLTPTGLSATICRVFPFWLPATIVVNQVMMQTVAAVASSIQLGIFNSAGTQVWASGTQSTVAGNMAVSVAALSLSPGQYYFATTNANLTSAVAAYQTTPAFTAVIPRWGTVAAVAGAMPASITPSGITETVGGFMCYVELSNWTT